MAAARYTCPSCKATLKVADALPPGKIIKCPACAVTFRVTVAQALAPSPGLSHGPAQPSGGMPRPAQGEASPEEEPDRDEELEDRPPRRPAKVGGPARAPRRQEKPVNEALDDEEPEEGLEDNEEEDRPRRRSSKRRKHSKDGPEKGRLALRIAILTLAILGSVLAGVVGIVRLKIASDPEEKTARELLGVLAEEEGSKALKDRLARYDRFNTAGYFLLMALPVGVAGGVLTFMGRPKLGGGLMLATVPVPAVLSIITLAFTFFLLLSGGLSFLIRTDAPSKSGGSAVWAFIGGGLAVFMLWVVLLVVLSKLIPKLDSDVPGRERRNGRAEPDPTQEPHVEVLLGLENYQRAAGQVEVGRTIKVRGELALVSTKGNRVVVHLAELERFTVGLRTPPAA